MLFTNVVFISKSQFSLLSEFKWSLKHSSLPKFREMMTIFIDVLLENRNSGTISKASHWIDVIMCRKEFYGSNLTV